MAGSLTRRLPGGPEPTPSYEAYEVRSDGMRHDSSTSTVTIHVDNHAPGSYATYPYPGPVYSACHDTPLQVTTSYQSLLSYAYDYDGDHLTTINFTQPSHGAVSGQPDGTFVYTPNHPFS